MRVPSARTALPEWCAGASASVSSTGAASSCTELINVCELICSTGVLSSSTESTNGREYVCFMGGGSSSTGFTTKYESVSSSGMISSSTGSAKRCAYARASVCLMGSVSSWTGSGRGIFGNEVNQASLIACSIFSFNPGFLKLYVCQNG